MTRLAAILCLLVASLRAAEPFTIQDPGTNALVLLFIGDGWQASERGNFLRFVTNANATITNQLWISGYPHRVKTLALFTNSNQSGITATAPNSDTPLGGYVSGQSLRQDVTKLGTIINGSPFVSEPYLPITVFNIGDYKGTTLNARLIVTTNQESQILAHELGHLVGNLGDEYSGSGDVGSTNVASSLVNATNYWGPFITSGAVGAPVSVDSFFVPTETCKMGADISQQFCVVCSNELVRVFFQRAGITNAVAQIQSTLSIGTLVIGNPP